MRDFPLHERTIGRVIAEKAERVTDRSFLRWQGRDWCYAELERMTNRYVNGFAALGVRHGDRVALMVPNCPELLWALWGLGKLGAVAVALNTAAKGDMLRYFVAQSDARCLVVDDECPDHRLHLGHDRPLQGRDVPAVAGARHRPGADARLRLHARRRALRLPAALPRQRALVLVLRRAVGRRDGRAVAALLGAPLLGRAPRVARHAVQFAGRDDEHHPPAAAGPAGPRAPRAPGDAGADDEGPAGALPGALWHQVDLALRDVGELRGDDLRARRPPRQGGLGRTSADTSMPTATCGSSTARRRRSAGAARTSRPTRSS